jgi:hypothetical protein
VLEAQKKGSGVCVSSIGHDEELLWCCKHAKGGGGGVMKLYLLGSCFRRHAEFC